MMPTNISYADFEALARRAGLNLSDAQIANLHEAFGYIEAMVENIRQPTRGREPEPALIFTPEIR